MFKVRRKRCRECNQLFKPTYSTTQIVCSPKCAYSYSKRRDEEIKEKNDKELQLLEKEYKARKGITTLLKSVKDACHKYIRLRDKGKPCISCGTPYHKDFQAGHFYKAELYSNLRFNEHNIHGQCVKCNIRLEGNLNDYDLNLPNRIGQWKYNILKSEAESYKQSDFKWDREQLKKLRSYYNNKIKELNNGNIL